MAKVYKSITELVGKTPLLEVVNYEKLHGLRALRCDPPRQAPRKRGQNNRGDPARHGAPLPLNQPLRGMKRLEARRALKVRHGTKEREMTKASGRLSQISISVLGDDFTTKE